MYRKFGKRLCDLCFSFFGLVVFSPIFLLISLWVKLDSKGPVIFRQRRVGKGKTHFTILKFRTMRTDTPSDTATHLLAGKKYLTRAGRILRRTSLDELPQLWNILVGDMSLVGPRPALWNQYDLVAERDRYGANDIAPGLTGWAQVHGRDELPIPEKARLDGVYAAEYSLKMDAVCILRTFKNVFTGAGIVEKGSKPGAR